MRTFLLSPTSWPGDLAKEQTFLQPELPVLLREYDRVVVAPQQLEGAWADVPAGVVVDASLSRALQGGALTLGTAALRSGLLLSERTVPPGRAALRRLVAFAGQAQLARSWARQFLDQTPGKVVLCTYWWGAVSTGFGLARRGRPEVRAVSRAHGYDLYPDRHVPAWLPLRHLSASVLDGLYPDSQRGVDFARAQLGPRLRRCEVARLGVRGGPAGRGSADGVLRVASCSVLVAVKRVGLLIEGLRALAQRVPGLKVEWTHHGTGPLGDELRARMATLPASVKATFAGYRDQASLLRWYEEQPVDVFVNVSESEGTPVAAMEAISRGVPMCATEVGGNPEVCTPLNGVRLPATPSPVELADALLRFRPGPDVDRWRAGSLALWARQYDAEANLTAFARAVSA